MTPDQRWPVTPRLPLAALAIAGLFALPASPVAAHVRLERSVPAAGDTLRRAPAELRLVFSEPVVPRYTSLTLISPAGKTVALPDLRAASGNRQVFIPRPGLALAGDYRLEWRAVAGDGHVVTGAFQFTLLSEAVVPAGAAAAAEARAAQARRDSMRQRLERHRVNPGSLPAPLRPASAPNGAARLLQFAAILALIGAAVFRGLLLPGAGLMPTVHYRVSVAIRRFAGLALLLLLLTLPLRLWLESAALHGPELALQPTLIGNLITSLPWGQAWAAQVLAALLAAIGILTGFTPLLASAALGLAFTLPFQGHANAVEPLRALAIAADGIHVLAAGAWIGTLAVLFTTVLPTLFRDGLERGGHDTARVLERFSPLALTAAVLLAVAGTISAALHFHSLAELATTAYGRVLLIKLVLVLLVLASGWYNWQRARPHLPLHSGVRALRRGALGELLFATAALAVTAFLVALPTP